jgi:type IV secretory pathway VirB10-like protein
LLQNFYESIDKFEKRYYNNVTFINRRKTDMKKIFSLLLAMMMVFALCACGGSSDDAAETETTTEAAVEAAAEPAAEAAAEAAAPADDTAAPEAPAGEAVEGDGSGESSQEQTLELFDSTGYDKTFEGYIQWVRDALQSQDGNPNLESDLETLDTVTEDTYDPDSMPFSMQIQFGLITSYEDFIG